MPDPPRGFPASNPLSRPEVEHIEETLDYLRYEDNTLNISGIPAITWVGDLPAIVYSVDRAIDNYRDLLTAFGEVWPTTSVHFAMKSCYVRPVLEAMLRHDAGLEVMSEVELQMALQCGAAAPQIVSTGVGRSPAYLSAVDRLRPRLVVIDNAADLRRTSSLARRYGRRQRVALRLTPSTDTHDRYVNQASKLGADWADGGSGDLLRAVVADDSLDLTGLHCHVLGHCAEPGVFAQMVRDVVDTASEISERHGIQFQILDLGGGLEARFLIERRGYTSRDFAAAAASELKRVGYGFDLILEPGRYVTGDAAVGVTRTAIEKSNSGLRFLITDLSSNVLIPRPRIDYPVIPLSLPSDASALWSSYHVGDRTCTPQLFTQDALLPDSETAQGLCILNCGAYTTVFAELWAFPLPRIVAVEKGVTTEVFGREQQQAMWKQLHQFDMSPGVEPSDSSTDCQPGGAELT